METLLLLQKVEKAVEEIKALQLLRNMLRDMLKKGKAAEKEQ
jgi:hypothetical protein